MHQKFTVAYLQISKTYCAQTTFIDCASESCHSQKHLVISILTNAGLHKPRNITVHFQFWYDLQQLSICCCFRNYAICSVFCLSPNAKNQAGKILKKLKLCRMSPQGAKVAWTQRQERHNFNFQKIKENIIRVTSVKPWFENNYIEKK